MYEITEWVKKCVVVLVVVSCKNKNADVKRNTYAEFVF